jgi:DNA-binding transcriptional MerR regulator/methylmalonyl-CoA mutase cobalamin-binding subunit
MSVMSKEPMHPIGVVARKTGVRADLIRAWERRHRAVEPCRSAGNHRLYTDADVERLRLIRGALEAGWQIGHVATLDSATIEALIRNDSPADAPRSPLRPPAASAGSFVERCVDQIVDLDEAGLRRELDDAAVTLSRTALLESLIVPLLREIGEGWRAGRLRAAHEHLASSVIRSFLAPLGGAYRESMACPAIVVTTPAHQYHELAAMLVATSARDEGWRSIYLGPNLPAHEIAVAVEKAEARAVALSITFPPDDPDLDDQLRTLHRLLPPDVALFVGGRSAGAYAATLDEVDALRLDDLSAFRARLAELRTRSPGRRVKED